MMSTRASRGIAVVLATLTLLSFSTAVAFAAPATTTWSAERPARGAVVSAPVAEEGVTVSCTADLVGSTRQFLVDGVSSWSLYTNPAGGGHAVWSELWDDDAESWTSGWVWTTTPDLTRGTLSASRAIRADGSHTVSVTLGNSSGTSSTDTWTFSVRIPPTLGAPTPAPGSSVNATNPVIEIPAADNSAVTSWTATLNGAPVASTFDSVTGKVRLTLPAALSNDSVDTATVSVFDALGLRTDRTWSFTVQTYPEMTGQLPSCISCHPSDAADPDMGTVCGNCHQTNHVGVPSALHIKADVSACSPCHVSDLTVEHARHISSKGVAVTCVDCHASTDPKVVSAIASKNSACSGCHTFVNHLTQHEVTRTDSCAGAGCHVATNTNLTTIHPSCATCHDSAVPAVVAAIAGHTKDCSACHATVDHATLHNVVRADACTSCHVGTNLATIHPSCATCHDSAAPAVVAAIAGHNTNCSACHPASVPVIHAAYHAVCSGCHGGPSLNNHGVLPAQPYTTDCVACHGSPFTNKTAHSYDAGCANCHE